MKREPRGSFFHSSGFSLPELVAVIAIVAVISAVAMTRFSGAFATARGFYDELLSQVQYARKVAIAQRRPVFVRIDASESRLCYSAAGTCTLGDAVASPSGSAPFRVAVPAGVTVTLATFQFDGLGRYVAAAPLPITVAVAGEPNLQFSVEHETGYVHP
jgi:MSHA pilin protein MshC